MKSNFFNKEVIFTTNSYALFHGIKLSSASRQLSQYHKKHIIEKITRGVWANINHPYYNPLVAVPYLLGNERGYVSFLTALHSYGIISQIPSRIQIATTGHCRKLKSSIGYFEFIHLSPQMMMEGISWSQGKNKYLIASPEKALLGTFYISTRKGNRFSSLPELDIESLNMKEFKRLIKNTDIQSKMIQAAIRKRIENKL